MKKTFLFLLFILISSTVFSRAYLGVITKDVNFREGSSTDANILSSLKPITPIFITSLETENDYYNIISIDTDREGYLHKSYVKVRNVVNKSNESFFSPTGQSANFNPRTENLQQHQ